MDPSLFVTAARRRSPARARGGTSRRGVGRDDFGIVAVEAQRVSPPVLTPPGTTVGRQATVTAQDSLTKKTYALRARSTDRPRRSPPAAWRRRSYGTRRASSKPSRNYSDEFHPSVREDEPDVDRGRRIPARAGVPLARSTFGTPRCRTRSFGRRRGRPLDRPSRRAARVVGARATPEPVTRAAWTCTQRHLRDANDGRAPRSESVNGLSSRARRPSLSTLYLSAFGPTTKIAAPEERRADPAFTPWRRRYASTVPRGVTQTCPSSFADSAQRGRVRGDGRTATSAYADGSASRFTADEFLAVRAGNFGNCDRPAFVLRAARRAVFDDCAEYVITTNRPLGTHFSRTRRALRGLLSAHAGPPDVSAVTRTWTPAVAPASLPTFGTPTPVVAA